MFAVGGLLSHQTIPAYANAGIVFIYLFGIFTGVAWTPINNLYPAEIMSFDIRARGLAFQALCTQSAGLIGTFGVPAALVKLNYKLYFIFGCWNIIGIAVQYLTMPETKGIPLEQMEDVFSDPSPRRAAESLVRVAREKRKQENKQRASAA